MSDADVDPDARTLAELEVCLYTVLMRSDECAEFGLW